MPGSHFFWVRPSQNSVTAKFAERPEYELRRIHLPRTRVYRVGCPKDQKTLDAVCGSVGPRHFWLGRELPPPALSPASVGSPTPRPLEATPNAPNRARCPT